MRAYAIAAFLCVVAATNGYAADLPVAGPPAAVPYAPPTRYDWNGFYVGVNGGYGFGTTSWATPGFTTGNFNFNGALAGGTIGINYQSGPFVFGFEADADWTGFKGSSNNAVCSALTPGGVCETRQYWMGTARGRFGYAIDRLLLFATAGGAIGDIGVGLSPPGTFDVANNFGWTAGGGIEAGLIANWTVKVEYLYVNLGNASCNINCGNLQFHVPSFTIPVTENLVRVGINYKLPF